MVIMSVGLGQGETGTLHGQGGCKRQRGGGTSQDRASHDVSP